MSTAQPTNPMPDHRSQERDQTIAELRQMVREQQDMINRLATQRPQAPQDPNQIPEKAKIFKPEVLEGVQEIVQQSLRRQGEAIGQDIRILADQNDHLRFNLTYGTDTYKKYGDQIERLVNQRRQQGQNISREDAYKHIYFEENGRKPRENPAQVQPPEPKFDPYYEKVMPPTQQTQTQPTVQNQPQVGRPAQDPSQPLDVIPQVNNFQNQPTNQPARSQDFGLPPDVPSPGTASAASPQLGGLELTTDEKSLDAWAEKNAGVNF